jgi:hypothetical protein
MKAFMTLLFVLLTLNVFANNSEIIDEGVEPLTEKAIQTLMTQKHMSCQASTPCRFGGFVSCQTWGAGCTWFVQPYMYVQCTGYNQFGYWVNAVGRCF